MIKSKNSKGGTLLQQLWFERASKTLKHLEHFANLMDQFEYMGEMAYRLQNDCLAQMKKSTKEEKNEKIRVKKTALVGQLRSFLEIYQTVTIKDYDFWDFKNGPKFSLFVEKFENEAQSLEHRCT